MITFALAFALFVSPALADALPPDDTADTGDSGSEGGGSEGGGSEGGDDSAAGDDSGDRADSAEDISTKPEKTGCGKGGFSVATLCLGLAALGVGARKRA